MSTVIASVVGSVLAALVAAIGIVVTRAQAARSDRRLALETTVSGLKLLMTSDGATYAPGAVVAGALATLIHLEQPVVAMRALAPSWDQNKIDAASATWLVSEIFVSSNAQAQLEAAAMLDAHATELCGDEPGQFSWPASVEFQWIPNAPLPARLRLMRAVMQTLLSRSPAWWRAGGRLGWGAEVLHQAMRSDGDWDLRSFAADALGILVPFVEQFRLVDIQSAVGWVSIAEIEHAVDDLRKERQAQIDSGRKVRTIVMLTPCLDALRTWASPQHS
jgi:hypothetical protein